MKQRTWERVDTCMDIALKVAIVVSVLAWFNLFWTIADKWEESLAQEAAEVATP